MVTALCDSAYINNKTWQFFEERAKTSFIKKDIESWETPIEQEDKVPREQPKKKKITRSSSEGFISVYLKNKFINTWIKMVSLGRVNTAGEPPAQGRPGMWRGEKLR